MRSFVVLAWYFSNAKGGTVYVGVTDKGKVSGVTLGRETVPKFVNEIKHKTYPSVTPDIEIIDVGSGKSVVSLSVGSYPIKPVSAFGKYFKRVNASNHQLNADDIANMHLQTLNTSWDFYVAPMYGEKDLSKEKIANFIEKIKRNNGGRESGLSDKDILNKLKILRDGKVTFGAYLLFNDFYCVLSDVQVGRFKSPTMIIDSVSFNTDLFEEVEGIIAAVKKHLMVEFIVTGEPAHIERFDYPLDAIREIVVNMVIHRDYRESGTSIIKIFDDRIEFYNPGKLYGDITIDDLLSGNYSSSARNKLIAMAFKEAGIIERYGSGIVRVRKICREYGVKEPHFREMCNGFMVTLYKERVDGGMNGGMNGGMKNTTDKIIELIRENSSVSISDISETLNFSRSTIQKHIEKLKARGIIERIGPDRGGYWRIIDG